MRALSLPDCPLADVAHVELEALDDGPSSPSNFAEVAPDAPSSLGGAPTEATAWTATAVARDGRVVATGVLTTLDSPDDDAALGALYRTDAACTLAASDGTAASLPAFVHFALGEGDAGTLLAGGSDDGGRARADAVWLDARTGEALRVAEGLLRRRDDAVLVGLGAGFLVAGGRDGSQLWSDAEWIDPSVRPLAFVRTPIALSEPRAEAAAVTLSSGDALLVGGRGTSDALDTLEAIDATTHAARSVDLAHLATPRRAPRGVRLAFGSIAVLGGFDLGGAAAPDVEILSPDATHLIATIPLSASAAVDALALPSGALLVARRDAGPVDLSLVHLDGAVGTVEHVATDAAASAPPRLVLATDGRPLLWDGALHRVDLWTTSIVDVPVSLSPDVSVPFSLGLGVVAVAHRSADALSFSATRYDVRNPLSVDPELGLGNTTHLSQDRLSVQALRSGLQLPAGARVAVADTTYGAFTLRLFASGRDLPFVELRTSLGALVARVGDDACAFPPGSADFADVVRDAEGNVMLVVGDATRACAPSIAASPPPRVTITMIASPSGASVHGFTVTRGA